MIAVHQVTVASKWARAYRQLAREIYADDPAAPPSLPGCASSTTDDRQPFFGHGRGRSFIVVDGTRPVARATGFLQPPAHNRERPAIGYIGHFESLRDPDAARLALGAAVEWLAGAGATKAIGPVDFPTWNRHHLVTGGDGSRPFFLEPYNPSYYPDLFAASGFAPEHRYVSRWATNLPEIVDQGRVAGEQLRRAGFVLRPLDLRHSEDELRLLYQLSRRILAASALYEACPYDEFRALYAGVRRLLPPRFAWIAHAPDGQPAGFVCGVPDLTEPLRARHGRRWVLGAARYWWARNRVDTNVVLALGVVAEHRRTGLASWLASVQQEQALRRGLTRSIQVCAVESSPDPNTTPGRGQPLRTYALYGRSVPAKG